MVPFAITTDGKPVYPESFDESEWQALKDTYIVGELLMPCCPSPAIPKTSIYNVQFFAHLSGECATSPESQWHLTTKDLIVRELRSLGANAILERSMSGASRRMKPDVYFEWQQRKVAIEVQHSYQTFREYLRRQEKYWSQGIENYWLLYKPRYLTLSKSIAHHKIKKEFGGKFPTGGFFPAIPELPVALFDLETEGGLVRGGASLRAPVSAWLKSITDNSFSYVGGAWIIANKAIHATCEDARA